MLGASRCVGAYTVKADTDGKATICFRLPAAFKGGVEVTLTDGQSSAGFGVLVF